jgi:hypothetical protein
MTKLELQSIIEKYHLDGLVEGVKWAITRDKVLSINFMSPTQELIGKVLAHNFPLPESIIGINDTTQLDKILSITDGDIHLDYIKEGKVLTKLTIADKQFNLNYTLAEPFLIRDPLVYNGAEEYKVKAVLNDEIISALTKAKNALPNSENVVIELYDNLSTGPQLNFIFGGDVEFSNKVTYSIKDIETKLSQEFKLTYNSDLLKSILVCNKGASVGKLFLNPDGLMKLDFEHSDDLQSTYYVVAKAN